MLISHNLFLYQLSKQCFARNFSAESEPRVWVTISLPLEKALSDGALVAEVACTLIAMDARPGNVREFVLRNSRGAWGQFIVYLPSLNQPSKQWCTVLQPGPLNDV